MVVRSAPAARPLLQALRATPHRTWAPALVVLLSIPLTGCAILSFGQGGHEGGSATLRDAAAEARRDSSGKTRALDVGATTPPTIAVGAEAASDLAPAPEMPGAPEAAPAPPVRTRPLEHEHMLAGLVGGGGALGGHDYDGFETYGLSYGIYPYPRLRVDGIVSASDLHFTGESVLGRSFENAGELSLDVTVRYYLTEAHTVLGLYPIAGLGTGTLFWDYARPVPLTEDGGTRMVEDDHINYFSLFGGAGMSLLQTRHVHVGGNLVGGVRFYGWHTDNGFRNDMLPTTGFVRVLFDLNYHWDHAY